MGCSASQDVIGNSIQIFSKEGILVGQGSDKKTIIKDGKIVQFEVEPPRGIKLPLVIGVPYTLVLPAWPPNQNTFHNFYCLSLSPVVFSSTRIGQEEKDKDNANVELKEIKSADDIVRIFDSQGNFLGSGTLVIEIFGVNQNYFVTVPSPISVNLGQICLLQTQNQKERYIKGLCISINQNVFVFRPLKGNFVANASLPGVSVVIRSLPEGKILDVGELWQINENQYFVLTTHWPQTQPDFNYALQTDKITYYAKCTSISDRMSYFTLIDSETADIAIVIDEKGLRIGGGYYRVNHLLPPSIMIYPVDGSRIPTVKGGIYAIFTADHSYYNFSCTSDPGVVPIVFLQVRSETKTETKLSEQTITVLDTTGIVGTGTYVLNIFGSINTFHVYPLKGTKIPAVVDQIYTLSTETKTWRYYICLSSSVDKVVFSNVGDKQLGDEICGIYDVRTERRIGTGSYSTNIIGTLVSVNVIPTTPFSVTKDTQYNIRGDNGVTFSSYYCKTATGVIPISFSNRP